MRSIRNVREITAHATAPHNLLTHASVEAIRPSGVASGQSWLAYVLAVAATVAAVLVVFGCAIGDVEALILLLTPSVLSASIGGLGPGVLSTLVASLGAYRTFSAPGHALTLMAAGLLISVLNGAVHRWRRRAEAALRERVDLLEQRGEGALRESRERYRSLFDNMLEGFAYCRMRFEEGVPKDFRYLEVNEAFERLTGLKDVAGRWVSDVIPGIQQSNPQLFEVYGRVALSGNPERLETFVEPLGIWFSIAVYSQSHEHFVAVFDDVTERKRAETLLRESEAKFRSYVELAPVGVVVADGTGRHVEANRTAHEVLGYEEGDLLNIYVTDLLVEDDVEAAQRFFADIAQAGRAGGALRLRRQDGAAIDAAVRAVKLGDNRFLAIFQDVTQQVQTEERLRLSEERFELAMRGANDGLWDWNLKTGDAYYSPRWKSMLGYAEEELENKPDTWVHVIHPDDLGPALTVMRNLVEARSNTFELEFRARHKDGHYVDILSRGLLSIDAQGEVVRLVGTNIDRTDRKLAEHALAESESRYRVALEAANLGAWRHDFATDLIRFDTRAADHFGFETVEVPFPELMSRIHPDDLERIRHNVAATLDPAVSSGRYTTEHRVVHRGGAVRWLSVQACVHFDGEGAARRPVFTTGTTLDITERKRAQELLRESEEKYRTLAEFASEWVYWLTPDGQFNYVSPSCERITGYQPAEFQQQPALLQTIVHPDDQQAFSCHVHDAAESKVDSAEVEFRIITRSGTVRWIAHSCRRICSRDGTFLGRRAGNRDITERVRAEEARAQLEAQLRLAQKMEALGTLAGGVAHDFNNILGAIIGNVELAAQDVGRNHPALESLDEIRKASRRAKDLVQRILAFSRLQPHPQSIISLRPVLAEAVTLLRATLPAGIELAATFDADAPMVLADATQVHQVVMNLCTNAWQAMGGHGGRIDIRLDGVTLDADAEEAVVNPALRPGRAARLSVTDTGSGMDPATLERIFEPFFTTKPVGQGTGLGLSVVHGIVKAQGGTISVTSQPGKGTTFTLYFPAADVAEEGVAPAAAAPDPSPATSNHHVLYLDDEEALVFLVTRTLERLGYSVSGYTRVEEALAAVRADSGQFDLLVTDLNMPGQSGLEVAR